MRGRWGLSALALVAAVGVSKDASAIDLNGAWSTDVAVCDKIFVKKGGMLAFQRHANVHGGGFVIDRQSIRGPAARCKLTRKTEKGDMIHLLASCSSDIMLSSVQFSLRAIGDDKVARIFPGLEGMEVFYYRCPPR